MAEIRIGRSVYTVVAARDVAPRPPHLVAARDLVRRAVGRDSWRLREYLDRAHHLGMRPERADPIEVAARLLYDGTLSLARLCEVVRPVDAPSIHDLVDLAHSVHPEGPRPQSQVDSEPVTEAETWVSFEVVDDRGSPVEGSFRCSIDGAVQGGSLSADPSRYEPVSSAASAQVYLELLRWPADVRGDDSDVGDGRMAGSGPSAGGSANETPTGGVDPIVVGDGAGFIDLEIVDEEGSPLDGVHWALELPNGEALQGTTDAAARVRVEGVEQGSEAQLVLTLPEAVPLVANGQN